MQCFGDGGKKRLSASRSAPEIVPVVDHFLYLLKTMLKRLDWGQVEVGGAEDVQPSWKPLLCFTKHLSTMTKGWKQV